MDISTLVTDHNPWWRDSAHRLARHLPARRDLQPTVLERLRSADRRAVVVVGPRQVGKTTLLLQVADDLLDAGLAPGNLTYFDFSDHRMVEELSPDDVARVGRPRLDADQPRVLLLDEISYTRSWDRWLKQAVDRGGYRIAVTDSSAGLLREGGRESGAGRWDELVLEGLTYREAARLASRGRGSGSRTSEAGVTIYPNFLERYLALGGFPEYLPSEDFRQVRRRLRVDIVDRAILHDLLRFGLDVERIAAFFVYLVQNAGEELNVSRWSREVEATRKSLGDWLAHLEATGLVVRLPKLSPSAARGMKSTGRAKIHAADHGLINALALDPTDDTLVRPRQFETAVFRHLREVRRDEQRSDDLRLAYHRDRKGEIDFVLTRPGGEQILVEVTSSRQIRPEKVERLRHPGIGGRIAGRWLIYGGFDRTRREGIEILPLERFLLDPEQIFRGGDDE